MRWMLNVPEIAILEIACSGDCISGDCIIWRMHCSVDVQLEKLCIACNYVFLCDCISHLGVVTEYSGCVVGVVVRCIDPFNQTNTIC